MILEDLLLKMIKRFMITELDQEVKNSELNIERIFQYKMIQLELRDLRK